LLPLRKRTQVQRKKSSPSRSPHSVSSLNASTPTVNCRRSTHIVQI
jgi:hypothetical protein